MAFLHGSSTTIARYLFFTDFSLENLSLAELSWVTSTVDDVN
jgi:hypothetical protein